MVKIKLHSVNPPISEKNLSRAIGHKEAWFLLKLLYWLNICGTKNHHDHTLWVYNTLEQWQQQFHEDISIRTLQRVVARLRELGLIETAHHHKNPGYRVNFYRVNFNKLKEVLLEAKSSVYSWVMQFSQRFFNWIKTKTTEWRDKHRHTSSKEHLFNKTQTQSVDKFKRRDLEEPPPTTQSVFSDRKEEIRGRVDKRLKALAAKGLLAREHLTKGIGVLGEEIMFHIERYWNKYKNAFHAINSAVKLVCSGEWKTPYGFSFNLEEKSAEYKKRDLEWLRGFTTA
jgi:hypothetical protein